MLLAVETVFGGFNFNPCIVSVIFPGVVLLVKLVGEFSQLFVMLIITSHNGKTDQRLDVYTNN